MSWPAINSFRGWVKKRRGLLTGLLGVAVDEAVQMVPGSRLAIRIVGEVAKHGVERLADTRADVPDLKAVGQVFPKEQLDEINVWLETLTASYTGLLDQLEQRTTATGDEPIAEITALVQRTLASSDDLLRQFDATAQDVRRVTLSLSRVEEKLDSFFHGQERIGLCLEDIKEVLVNSPLPGEWAAFRKARPEAVEVLNRADEHFLAGRRDDGAKELLSLLRQRGVGDETVCRALGIEAFARGQLREANKYLARSGGSHQTMTPGLVATMTGLGTAATRGPRLPVWRSLARGLVVDRRYRIEAEVGRGGMASVYRAIGVDWVNPGQVVALKVPAADLLADPAARARFVNEIRLAQQLSGKHPAIVETFGYAFIDDPHSGRELCGLVMEFIDGPTLAHFLAQRQGKNKPLEPKEVLHILKPVCEALEYAHSQGVCHRDIKPPNVLLTRKSKVKLADFGIARFLEDARATVTGQPESGTPVYMPPDRDFDARSDVYLLGNLLLELLTFDPRGDVEARADCPPAWTELVADSMNRLKGKRPQTARQFLDRLESHTAAPPPVIQVKPLPAVSPLDRIRELLDGERFEEAMAEYKKLPHEGRRPALLKELQDKWRAHAHALARDAAETDHDFAAAAALLEKLPETLRDNDLLSGYRTNRDRLAELLKVIHDDAENRRYSFQLRARVAEYRRLKPDDAAINELQQMLGDVPREVKNSLGMKLVLVPRGSFWMGERDSKTQVAIPHDFYLGAFPVTQEQWQAVMGNNPSHFRRGGSGADKVKEFSEADLKQFPVECVSWDDIQQFLAKLNDREKKGEFLYRLPTEAEWEYSCRGGASSEHDCSFDFYFAQPTNDLSSDQANFDGRTPGGNASKGKYLERTSKVGSYKPNKLGLYDMHGNVWEWVEDLFDAGGSVRVIRGGSWHDVASDCRAADRIRRAPSDRGNDLGFRLAAVPSSDS